MSEISGKIDDKSSPSGVIGWVDERLPILSFVRNHLTHYYTPKNFNFWYFFGSLAFLILFLQIFTGIFLAMHYKPDAKLAFDSVEFIMRDVNLGWLIRYMHSTGASFFFIVLYLHMFRGMLYGSYKQPRELIWLIGMMLYFCLMAEAFFGYILPWGNMSYWAAQVIVNLFGLIPYIGDTLVEWIRGDYYISDITLNRFFALHVIAMPLAILGLVFVHIVALHHIGSNNPDGIEIKNHKDEQGKPIDGVAFHPFHTSKDLVGIIIFLMLYFGAVFFAPEMGGLFLEVDNFEPADPLKTPEHIVPSWYFTPYYAILRSIPEPLLGAIALVSAVLCFVFLPWLDRCKVKSIRYRGWQFKLALSIFVISFVSLGYLGLQPSSGIYLILARLFTVLYFSFFLLMPLYTRLEKTKPVPDRVVYKK